MFSRIGSIIVIDLLLLLVCIFVILINVDSRSVDTPYDLAVFMKWNDGHDTDEDVYVLTPSGKVAYFHNRDVGQEGVVLTRDDVGKRNDAGPENYEVVEFRSPKDGTYYISLHTYNNFEKGLGEVTFELISKARGLVSTITVFRPDNKMEVGVWKIEIKDGKVVSVEPSELLIRKTK